MFMSGKGEPAAVIMLMMMVSVISGILIMDEADGAAPVFSSVSFDPEEPSFEDDINVSVVFNVADEPITAMTVQICHEELDGSNALCEPPLAMADTGDGETFFAIIPSGGYGSDADALFYSMHFTATHGEGNMTTYPSEPDSHEINLTVVRKATEIMVDAIPDKTTVYPNETISVSGKITDDLDENVSGAMVNLTVLGEGITNSTTSDVSGDFDLSVIIAEDGNYTLNLTVEKDGMMAYGEWDVTVNTWPIPDMELSGGLGGEGEDIPHADPYEFYTGANLSIDFSVHNHGTGTAYNVTVIVNISGLEDQMAQPDIPLVPQQGFGGSIPFNTSTPGDFTVTITVDYDQDAPEIYRQSYDPVVINISIRDPPTWEDHRVLVEMFTQTTCVPCVDVEEAIERLHAEDILDFDFIVYVFDDAPSQEKATELGVTSTPDLFVDHTYDRKTGGGDLPALRGDLISMIENASSRDTPPVDIELTEANDTTNVSLGLRSIYSENVSGILQVHLVEAHSNLRNMQGIPIANRYLETIHTEVISGLSPGGEIFAEVPSPGHGEGLVAVLYDDGGKVLQTSSNIPGKGPEVYMKEGSDLFRIDSPGEKEFNITIERFQFNDTGFEDILFGLSVPDLPEGWNLGFDTIYLGETEYNATFSGASAESEVLESTRIRFTRLLPLKIEIPGEANGTFSFHVNVNSSGHFFSWSVVVIATPEEGPSPQEPSLDNVYMQMDGDVLYLFAEASNLPDGAVVKGRILPCDYGEGAACGLPVDLTLEEYETGKYRGDASSVDLETYTHLTYNAWIEQEGNQLLVSEEVKEEISQLIGSTPADDDDDDDEEDDRTTLFIVIAVAAVLLVIIIIVVLLISRKNKEDLSAEE
jgi:thiol-disulfide isomerase/thioredoxin